MANKKRRCSHCKKYFDQESGIVRGAQFFCSKEHLIEYATSNKDKLVSKGRKIERSNLRDKKRELKPLSKWTKEAQAQFNKFIRLRDADLPCISCGRFHEGQYHAGHYRTTKAAPQIRFNEDNVSKQCSACNNYLSGNIEHYRPNLIKKIGLERVEALESNNEIKRYSVEELKEIIKIYREKCKELECKI